MKRAVLRGIGMGLRMGLLYLGCIALFTFFGALTLAVASVHPLLGLSTAVLLILAVFGAAGAYLGRREELDARKRSDAWD
jgi:hypothetical protein